MPIKRSYADHGDACATAHAMELLGDRWTYPIVRELMLAPKRFSELAEGVRGITPATLTTRLRDLQAAGLVERVELPAPARATARARARVTATTRSASSSVQRSSSAPFRRVVLAAAAHASAPR